MSQNIATLRRLVDAFNRRDTETALSILHPQVEFSSALVERKTYRGLQGMAQYRQDLDAVWSEWHTEGDRFIPSGDGVVQLYRIVGIGKASGVRVAQDIAVVWKFLDGKPRRGRVFLQQCEALEAVGLSGQDVHADS
jgi:ketosteroid isomerase-like protein